MVATFVVAMLIATGSVALLAFIPTWWMLVVALAVHAAGTVIVFLVVLYVATEKSEAVPPRRGTIAGKANPEHTSGM